MNLSTAAMAMNGVLEGIVDPALGENVQFSAVSTDTRTLQSGELFVALVGAQFNAHDCVDDAVAAGACAIVASESISVPVPVIRVENTLRALGALGAGWRNQYTPKIAAITGSCGKTSVKEMVASIVSQQHSTLSTQGNFNNEIGVPLTLLRFNESHEYGVLELGANHMGEIEYTSKLVAPHVAVVTNAGTAHIEGFGSADNIVRAKGEIYQSLTESGVAIINKDDPASDYWGQVAAHCQQRFFSITRQDVDFFVTDSQFHNNGCWSFTLHAKHQRIAIQLPLLGQHNIANAVTAAAVASELGIGLDAIKSGLEKLAPIKGRLFPIVLTDQLLIDDTYNASPAAIKAAAHMLGRFEGHNCIVLGDMAELGAHATSIHRDVGAYVAEQGIELMIAKGRHAADYLVGFCQAKNDTQRGYRFDTHDEVAEYLINEKPDTLLIKGSRSAAMDVVVDKLVATELSRRAN